MTCVWLLAGVTLSAAALGLAVVWAQGRDLYAPTWLRSRIETRLEALVPDVRVEVGNIVTVIDEEWHPRVRADNVRLVDPNGAEIAAFTEMRASLAPLPLLEGRLELGSVDISGIFVNLERDLDGRVSLSSGVTVKGPARKADNLGQMLSELGELLLEPGLANLRHVGFRSLTLRIDDHASGRSWTIDGGRMNVERRGAELSASADLALLGGGATVATLAANYTGRIDSRASEFGVTLNDLDAADIAAVGPAFAWLQALNAPISGSVRGDVAGDGTMGTLNVSLQIGAGAIQPDPSASPIPIQGARSYFSYLPAEGRLRFDELSVQSRWVSGRLEGQAFLDDTATSIRRDLVGQFRLSDLTLDPPDLYSEPVVISAAEMDLKLELDPFALRVGRLQITDQDRRLRAKGAVTVGDEGWEIAADASLDEMTGARLLELWPALAVKGARKWLGENMRGGVLRDADMAVRARQGHEPDLYLGFDFEEADFTFLKTMPPIEGASGHASLVRDRFVISLDAGEVAAPEGGTIGIAGSSFIVPDTRQKDGAPAVIRLRTDGSITATLALLDLPPLGILQKADLPVSLAEGSAQLNGVIALPLIKNLPKEEVTFDFAGTLRQVRTENLVKNRVLSAPELSLRADNDAVEIGGAGTLDGVAFDTTWRQPLGAPGAGSKVAGTIDISQAALDRFGIDLPPGTLGGEGRGLIEVDLPRDGPPGFSLGSDLRGLTLSVPALGWVKPASQTGDLLVAGTLGQVPQVDRLMVRGAGLSAEGSVRLREGGQLDRVRFDRVSLGGWLDAPIDIRGQGAGAPVAISLNGGTLDLRLAKFGESGAGSSENVPLEVALNRLQISDTIAIENLRGSFSTGGGLDGSFTGNVNGGTAIAGRVVPQNGRSAVRLTSQDAGGVFASAGLLKQARGGAMDLSLLPVGTGGAFDGTLNVRDTSVQDAPAMAALLNAISIVGLLDELSGNGIAFSEVDARFRMSPSQITLTEASAVGPSMGLSMDGIYSPASGQLQMQGVISPVYLINGIGSLFTRKGEGVLGFNYALTGPAQAPEVSVNPLSVLAPGMLRNIFRAPPPTPPRAEGEAPPSRAAQEIRPARVVRRGEDR
ncbi:hypothetical protein AB1M95_10315 [Sulfitobacter sp. LCG007]